MLQKNVETEIEGPDAMRESASRDDVDPGFGDRAYCIETNISACFSEGTAVNLRDRSAQIGKRKVVEHDGVDPSREHRFDLIEAVDFNLEVRGVREPFAGSLQRRGERMDTAGGVRRCAL